MNYSEQKAKLLYHVEELRDQVADVLAGSPQEQVMAELIEDIKQDFYTIVVVGEFKHGKSTFVNALLEQEIMPVDVTPTTATINAVFYGDEPEVHIMKSDGDEVKHTLSQEVLSQYTASADFNPDEIKYLKIFTPAPLLKERVVLVDTPGVNDLNQHRSDVTHQFIPRADVILFMLDMTSPVKHTEKKFLEERLLKTGSDRIMYVANFLDRVDEEEVEETIEHIEHRVQQITKGNQPKIYPISALEALQGKMSGNDDLVTYSGLLDVEKQITRLVENGSRSHEKVERFNERLEDIHDHLLLEIKTVEQLSNDSLDKLKAQLLAVEEWLTEQEEWQVSIEHYLVDREEEIQFMVQKSAKYFGNKLHSDLQTKIDLFQGNDIKSLVETQLPITIRTQFDQWVDQYSDYMQELLRKLQKEVSEGLSKTFQQSVQIHLNQEQYQYEAALPIISQSTGNASIKAGVAVGGASTLALLLGGPFLIPIVGMAGLPYLQQKIAEKQLEKVRPELKYNVEQHVEAIMQDFQSQLQYYISSAIQEIKRNSMDEFAKRMHYLKKKIDQEMEAKRGEEHEERQYQRKVTELKERLELARVEKV
ncbi:dynamin family protein [Halalkalibacter wakoensis JCM 9140]|uniref:Dynamin family protein n=1 Tax=Halalkalibacter wakoensis JCM 9140 TaxID=1236970 RepID=W4Q6T8_9BACI|nr:dynamin family protein [Halalkalibacter wakoensis]GAE27781.1 dynamin family protein [Halalkalibacter wakoensis JCM 9140]